MIVWLKSQILENMRIVGIMVLTLNLCMKLMSKLKKSQTHVGIHTKQLTIKTEELDLGKWNNYLEKSYVILTLWTFVYQRFPTNKICLYL